MAVILDGKLTSAKVRERIKNEVDALPEGARRPGLAVVIVGDDPASHVYVRNKKKGCEEVGFLSREYALPESTTEEELIALVEELNRDSEIDGILVQLPLPRHLDDKKVIEHIDPSKDVDAFSYHNVGRITVGDYDFLPCTPAGVMELLHEYNIDVSGKNAVVVGRSNIVGKPQALLLLQANATVTVAHSKTKNLSEVTRGADVLVVAIGKAKFVTADMVKEGAVVIDVGMDRDENGKLCGDVDFEGVCDKASYITPVPGGVGPMTITELLKNTLTSYKRRNNI
ncbi:MAG: bifunctional methylenetetrahydrofolate dehydrogenase/methenyltetrahydrofolate cyclohydrolase FolD [Clostridia bacterium]|nr:bifunctional methylenetetrahydrofolate dehydrogenase/methenyltetrahydrofolate cyclohydrolase FolD [Clostridia bacterium]